jgi:nitrate/nitrite transporter NarK
METILLGWYILSASGSVLMLVVYGSLQYLGSLVAPMFGVVCDRMGYRRMLWSTRATYALMAFSIMLLSYFQALTPDMVLILAAIVGTALGGAITHVLRGNVEIRLAMLCGLGGIPGVFLGVLASHDVSESIAVRALAALIVFVAVQQLRSARRGLAAV